MAKISQQLNEKLSNKILKHINEHGENVCPVCNHKNNLIEENCGESIEITCLNCESAWTLLMEITDVYMIKVNKKYIKNKKKEK